jgi:hypothetical protein
MLDARRVFLSYARRDADKVATLEEGLRSFGADVWLDHALVGGHEWWQAILREIRQRDVFVQAISPAGMDSEACTRERAYARALGKPILPVVVDAIDTNLLPDDLARLQLVLYIEPQPEHAFRLARALASRPSAPPLPEPLPEPPDVPVSYLHGLRDRVRAPSLTLDEQLALIGRLEAALERDAERTAALNLLRELNDRDDLYRAAAHRIARLIGPGPEREPRPEPEPEPEPEVELGPEPEPVTNPEPVRKPEPDPEPLIARPATLISVALLVAALTALAGGALRVATDPDDGADSAELLTLALARTIGWAFIVVAVAAVIARYSSAARPSMAVARNLVIGALAGLVGALVHGLLQYGLEVADQPTCRLVGLAVTGTLAGAYFGRSLQKPAAGLIGGLAGGLAAGWLVFDWPGQDPSAASGALSWILHAVPICAGALGLVLLRSRRSTRPPEPLTTALNT